MISAAEKRKLIERMYDETNKGNAEILFEVLAPNFVSYGGAGFQDLHGPQAFYGLWQTFTAAFPDLHFEVQIIVAGEDEWAAVRGIQTATHLGTSSAWFRRRATRSSGQGRRASNSMKTARLLSVGKTSTT